MLNSQLLSCYLNSETEKTIFCSFINQSANEMEGNKNHINIKMCQVHKTLKIFPFSQRIKKLCSAHRYIQCHNYCLIFDAFLNCNSTSFSRHFINALVHVITICINYLILNCTNRAEYAIMSFLLY